MEVYLVSIITPLYNCSDFLEQTIKSVFAQTYENWEMIMVDDCSQDNSLEIAESYALKDSRIKVLKHNKNSGAAIARNNAIAVATGRYIAFLDSDDAWLPQKLEKQINFMQTNHIAFSYTAYEKITEKGIVFGKNYIPQKVNYKTLLKTNVIGCLTAIYDSAILGKVYMPIENKREDFATWLKILKQIEYAYALPEVLAKYRVYKHQSSAKKLLMFKENWKLYRELENLSIIKSVYYFSHYLIRGFLRTKMSQLANFLKI